MTVKIIVGDCLPEMRKMPANSIHCVVTSCPYWGLRDYGIPPSVWGGDEACAHVWGAAVRTANANAVPGPNGHGGKNAPARNETKWTGPFCAHCGSWRGALGLEPTPDLFVDHMVMIFEEVRRVLRPDGTCWLNIGDSYASGAGAVGDHPGGGKQGSAWAGRPPPGATSMAGEGKRRANRDGTHAGKHTGMAALGPMVQPNRMPLPGLKPKDLVGVPWMLAFALRRAGWWLRQEIIWNKPNPMPESITDRCTKAHESIFLLTKSQTYFYDADAIAEEASENSNRRKAVSGVSSSNRAAAVSPKSVPYGRGIKANESFHEAGGDLVTTRNKRSVWTVATQPFAEAHFATFPPALIEPCVLAGTSERGRCPTCLAPWERVTAKVDTGRKQKMPDGMATHAGDHGAIHREGREKGATGNPVLETVTLGWWPGCSCDGFDAVLPPYPKKPGRAGLDDEATYQRDLAAWLMACEKVNARIRDMCAAVAPRKTVPAVVLDPFGGAGTTGMVADRAQRDAILIELNPGYAAMGRKRIDSEAPLFAAGAAE